MADIKLDHLQLPVQLGTDSVHTLGGLADDWAQDGTDDIASTDVHHFLVDMGQERELLSNWMDIDSDETSPSRSCLQERESIQHWSDEDDKHHLMNLQGSVGDITPSFGDTFLGQEYFESKDNSHLEQTLTLLDFSPDANFDRYKPPSKSQRRVRFQCAPDPESGDDVELNDHHNRSEEPIWTWSPTDNNLTGYFDPYDQFQNTESDSDNSFASSIYGNSDGLEIAEAAGAKESSMKCFYCNELFVPREPSSIVDMTSWNYLCPSCIVGLCERPIQQM